jgi:hypothetical protein
LGPKARFEIPVAGEILLELAAIPPDTSGQRATYRPVDGIPAEGTKILIALSIPEGQRVQLSSSRLTILGEQFEKGVELEEFKLSRDGRKFAATDELIGASYEPPSWSYWRHKKSAVYFGRMISVGSPPSTFRLVLPSLIVSGARVDIPPISFQLRDEYVVHGMCP